MSIYEIHGDLESRISTAQINRIAGNFKKLTIAICVLLSIAIFVVVQYGYAQERLGFRGGDIERYTEFFSDTNFYDAFYIKEFIYYFPGKFLTHLLGDAYATLTVFDYICFGAILFCYPALRRNPFYVFTVLMSPLFMTGFTNIHRQMIATGAYIIVDTRIDRTNVYKRLILSLFCVFIHDYVAIIAAIETVILLLMQKKRAHAAAFSVAAVLISYVSSSGYNKFEEASTSASTYTEWCVVFLIVGFLIDRLECSKVDYFRHVAFITLIVVSNIFFAINSGAAGGRLMLGGASIYFFRTLFPCKKRLQPLHGNSRFSNIEQVGASFLKPLFCAVLVLPAFFNSSTVVVMLVSLTKIREVL